MGAVGKKQTNIEDFENQMFTPGLYPKPQHGGLGAFPPMYPDLLLHSLKSSSKSMIKYITPLLQLPNERRTKSGYRRSPGPGLCTLCVGPFLLFVLYQEASW